MTAQELAEAIRNITENSVTKLKLESWISLEVGRIVNRKKYWWRKAFLQFDSEAGEATVDAPDDFMYMSTPLYEHQGKEIISELPFIADGKTIIQMKLDTALGQPTSFALEPGELKVFRLNPIPDTARSYAGEYYRGAIIKWTSPGGGGTGEEQDIPLIPPEFHYVAYQALERRAFFYMYGQKDPRAVLAAQAEKECLGDLDDFKGGSTLSVTEWRSSDPQSFIQSTR